MEQFPAPAANVNQCWPNVRQVCPESGQCWPDLAHIGQTRSKSNQSRLRFDQTTPQQIWSNFGRHRSNSANISRIKSTTTLPWTRQRKLWSVNNLARWASAPALSRNAQTPPCENMRASNYNQTWHDRSAYKSVDVWLLGGLGGMLWLRAEVGTPSSPHLWRCSLKIGRNCFNTCRSRPHSPKSPCIGQICP